MGVACVYILRSLPPQLRLALGAAPLHPRTLTVASVLPLCVGLHCLHDLQDLLIMKRNISCASVALLHPYFQVPYRPANIHPSKMVGITDHSGVRSIEFGKVIVRRLSRPYRYTRFLLHCPHSPTQRTYLSTPDSDCYQGTADTEGRDGPIYSATDSSTPSRNSEDGPERCPLDGHGESWRCYSRITRVVGHVGNHEVMPRCCQRTGQICLRKACTPTLPVGTTVHKDSSQLAGGCSPPVFLDRLSPSLLRVGGDPGASCSMSRVVIMASGTNSSLAFRDEKSASGDLACMHARCAHSFPTKCQGSNGS
ncbi:hypothetical protein EDD17DRAFT_341036 [Pisolithus thermaeus]|nr:hypothetical protein EDD17DRAFT_341036 [Pisolithus thermaeus]